MDEKLARQIRRQLRVISCMLVFFGALILLALGVGGYVAYKAYGQVKKAETSVNKLNDFTNSLQAQGSTSTTDLQKQLCTSSGSLGTLIRQQSNICN